MFRAFAAALIAQVVTAAIVMPRKECHVHGCRKKETLREVQQADGDLCAAILSARNVQHDWALKAAPTNRETATKTYLCDDHYPPDLEESLLGTKVARHQDGVLQFGAVTSVAHMRRDMRGQDRRILEMLRQPAAEWRYVVEWPTGDQEMDASQIRVGAAWADSIQSWHQNEAAQVAAQHAREMDAARNRVARAKSVAQQPPQVKPAAKTKVRLVTFPGVSGLWHALPTRIQHMLPVRTYDFEFSVPSSDHVSEMVIDTPAGTIQHSGGGLIFDIKQQNRATGFVPTPFSCEAGAGTLPTGLGWDTFDSQYFAHNSQLCKHLFGFSCYDELEHFLRVTWEREPDEPGIACPRTFTSAQEFSLALWRMRQRASNLFLAHFSRSSETSVSRLLQEWIPRCGRVGRSLVFIPSVGYLARTVPQSFREAGMESTAYIGDCTDLLTQTVRSQISVRNQQHSDKSKHSAAMGLSWCTPSGWTAIASDLVLGRTSEYNAAVAIAGKFDDLPPHWSLCYDKGVASLRAHLPNLNNVIVPCFLSGGYYTAEQAIRNRAIATNRYVIEITYQRVKQWHMLKPEVPRKDFGYLNDVWWWALGFANYAYRPLKPIHSVNVAVGTE